MPQVQRVLIVGAGIAGLTAAVAMGRRGIGVDVIDDRPPGTELDTALILPSNALRVLRGIGLGEVCVEAGFGFLGWRYFDAQGSRLAVVRSVNVAGPGFPAVIGIARSRFLRVLGEALAAQGGLVRTPSRVVALLDIAHGIRATFDNGESGCYDLVLRADGRRLDLHARSTSGPRGREFTGEVLWRCDFDRPADFDWGVVFHASVSKLALVPLPNDRMSMLMVANDVAGPDLSSPTRHAVLRRHLVEYGRAVDLLREQIVHSAGIHCRPIEVAAPRVSWSGGRILRIGEASRAGTSRLADGAAGEIEEAVLLADMLSESDDIATLLARFAARASARSPSHEGAGLRLGEWELGVRTLRPVLRASAVDAGRFRHAVTGHTAASVADQHKAQSTRPRLPC